MIKEMEPEEFLREPAPDAPSLLRGFGEFMSAEFGFGEVIGFELRRRELGLIASVTNAGKSTLLRNALLAMATGGDFSPLVERGFPRRVLLLDFESSASRLQSDLDRMTRDWPQSELQLLRENFFIACEAEVGEDILSLSSHLPLIERHAKEHKIDFLVIDTACAAFDLWDENSNSEVARTVHKPLLRLARNLDCPAIMSHHIGKAKSEDGAGKDRVHRPRGASAFSAYPASVFILSQDTSDSNLFNLHCAKRKSGSDYEVPMKLNRETRWFSATSGAMLALTNYEMVVQTVRRLAAKTDAAITRADIDATLARRVSKPTITRCLTDACKRGDVAKVAHGRYGLVQMLR
jgi:hypothetical protein